MLNKSFVLILLSIIDESFLKKKKTILLTLLIWILFDENLNLN